jgi:hypothetical protein
MKKNYLFDKHFRNPPAKKWWVVEGKFPSGEKQWAVLHGKTKLKEIAGPFATEEEGTEYLKGYLSPQDGEFVCIPACNGTIFLCKQDFPDINFFSLA